MARKKVSPVLKRPNGLLAEDVSSADDDSSSCLSVASTQSKRSLNSLGVCKKEVVTLCVDEKYPIWRCEKRFHLATSAALLCVAHVMILLQ